MASWQAVTASRSSNRRRQAKYSAAGGAGGGRPGSRPVSAAMVTAATRLAPLRIQPSQGTAAVSELLRHRYADPAPGGFRERPGSLRTLSYLTQIASLSPGSAGADVPVRVSC